MTREKKKKKKKKKKKRHAITYILITCRGTVHTDGRMRKTLNVCLHKFRVPTIDRL